VYSEDSIGLVVAVVAGIMVSAMVGYTLRSMIPSPSPKSAGGAIDISNKTVRELLESDMTIEDLIRSVWMIEDKLRR